MATEGIPQINIQRPLYHHDQLREDLQYQKKHKSVLGKLRPDKVSTRKIIASVLPVLKWLPKYKWRADFLLDLAAGYTVAIMHIPQGMAYALLGNAPPVVGIYMAIFPVLAYFFLGSSKHASMGTFSITCLMTGKAILEYSDPSYFDASLSTNDTSSDVVATSIGYSPIQVGCAVSLVAALVQLSMYCLRLGAVTNLLSDMLVSAFTCGSAFQIVVTQLKDLIGINIPKITGNFLTYKTLKAVFDGIAGSNYAALVISAITILVLVLNNEILKPIVAKKSSIPIPIELFAVVAGTLSSQFMELKSTYGVEIVGDIPTGLPQPELPPMSLFTEVITDGISIAIVSYAISISLSMMLAQKGKYEVSPNQELLAMGLSNTVGSFFSCMPICASLSRSMIQQVVGGKTQIVSIISSVLLIVTLLWIAPFFESLPKSVLAGVIIVSLKGLLMQVTQFPTYWRLSKLDAFIWITTFICVVFISMEIALIVGLVLSLMSILIFSFKPYTGLLGSVPNTDLYLDTSKYKGTEELEGVKIFHYCGGINFATRNIFRTELYKRTNLDPQKQLLYRAKLEKITTKMQDTNPTDYKTKLHKLQSKIKTDLKCIILDFSSVSYVDPSGVAMITKEIDEFKMLNVTFYIAACSDRVYNVLMRCDLISKKKNTLLVFPSIHDAVQSAVYNNLNSQNISTIMNSCLSSES